MLQGSLGPPGDMGPEGPAGPKVSFPKSSRSIEFYGILSTVGQFDWVDQFQAVKNLITLR